MCLGWTSAPISSRMKGTMCGFTARNRMSLFLTASLLLRVRFTPIFCRRRLPADSTASPGPDPPTQQLNPCQAHSPSCSLEFPALSSQNLPLPPLTQSFLMLLLGKGAQVLGMDKLLHGNQEMAIPHPHQSGTQGIALLGKEILWLESDKKKGEMLAPNSQKQSWVRLCSNPRHLFIKQHGLCVVQGQADGYLSP